MSHAVKMFKQMLLHTALLTRMLSIIILIVIPSIPKAVSSSPNIFFSTTLRGQKINQAVIATVEFVIYFICIASNIASDWRWCVATNGMPLTPLDFSIPSLQNLAFLISFSISFSGYPLLRNQDFI